MATQVGRISRLGYGIVSMVWLVWLVQVVPEYGGILRPTTIERVFSVFHPDRRSDNLRSEVCGWYLAILF